MQYWSDGQHEGAWRLNQGNVTLADATYFDSIATGLSDNLRRQGGSYAVVTVPVYDSSTATTVHISGFAQINLKSGGINTSSPSARGVWVTKSFRPVKPPMTGSSAAGTTGSTLLAKCVRPSN